MTHALERFANNLLVPVVYLAALVWWWRWPLGAVGIGFIIWRVLG